MKAIIKSIPIISALVISSAALAQQTPERTLLVVNPFDTNGDGVLDQAETAAKNESNGTALILRVYDLNGDGSIDPRTERLNFSQVSRNLRSLTIDDYPQLPILGIPAEFTQFDLNNDGIIGFSERSDARAANTEETRRLRRAEVREVAELFNVSRRTVWEVRGSIRRDASGQAPIAPELEPIRDELIQRLEAQRAQARATRAARFNSADFDSSGGLSFSEFLTLPAVRGALTNRPTRLEGTLRSVFSSFVRRDVNSTFELELGEFTVFSGDFLGN